YYKGKDNKGGGGGLEDDDVEEGESKAGYHRTERYIFCNYQRDNENTYADQCRLRIDGKYQAEKRCHTLASAKSYINGEYMSHYSCDAQQQLKFNKISSFRYVVVCQVDKVDGKPALEYIHGQD